jgi:hypothetical protein
MIYICTEFSLPCVTSTVIKMSFEAYAYYVGIVNGRKLKTLVVRLPSVA